MKSVCFVIPPSPFLLDDKVNPPLGVLYVAAAMRLLGYSDIALHDGPIEEIPGGYDVYGLSVTTPQFPSAVEALKHIRGFSHKPLVIIGGPHATIDVESCIDAGFDSVVMDAGEMGMHLAIEHNLKVVSAPWDTVMAPDRSIINLRDYKYKIDGVPATTVMTTRGCPYQCGFCCKVNKKVKIHPAETVIEELRDLHFNHGYNAFMFFDDIFTLDKKRAETILNEIKDWGIIFRCFLRADIAVRHGIEFLRLMKEAGCREVGLGVESGSDVILKAIHKGETSDEIKDGIALIKKAGIRVKGFIIVGLPFESTTTINETVKFLESADLDDVDLSLYQPYKRTTIFDNRQNYDIYWDMLDLKASWYKGTPGEYKSNAWTSTMSREELVAARDNLENKFKKWRPNEVTKA
uniref:Putative radical SAM superfamily protein n=1 Tax=viral metagenome TaxID=1070528 RepID=A0A6M3L419_9ZZZZ